jgi:hypothetical protein
MGEREYFNRMLNDLKALKDQVLSFETQKRKECGYLPIGIPKPISHTGRPLSADGFNERLNEITATLLWLQSILDKLNGLTSSCAIDLINLYPYPHPSQFKAQRGRKPLGKKTQERLLQKGFGEAKDDTGIGMRSWIKASQKLSEQISDTARKILDSGEPLLFMHVDEDGRVTYEAEPEKQRAFLDSRDIIKNHEPESLLRALTKGKQKSQKNELSLKPA